MVVSVEFVYELKGLVSEDELLEDESYLEEMIVWGLKRFIIVEFFFWKKLRKNFRLFKIV